MDSYLIAMLALGLAVTVVFVVAMLRTSKGEK